MILIVFSRSGKYAPREQRREVALLPRFRGGPCVTDVTQALLGQDSNVSLYRRLPPPRAGLFDLPPPFPFPFPFLPFFFLPPPPVPRASASAK